MRTNLFPSFLGGDFSYAVRIPTLSAPSASFWIATAAWMAALVAGAALLLSRRAPLEGAGVLWTFAALAPVLHLVPVGVLLAERLLYLPSAGFCLAAGVALARLLPATGEATPPAASRPPAQPPAWARRGAVPAALAAGLGRLTARTVVRTLDWRSAVAFWESELAKAPRQVVVNNNLAVALSPRGDHARACKV